MYRVQDVTGRHITLEWALIAGQNDSPAAARQLGALIERFDLRRDMVHVNVIPLNPTGGYKGKPSQRPKVNAFIDTLKNEYRIACTPRVRRGIDIDAGCGQLKSEVLKSRRTNIDSSISAQVENFSTSTVIPTTDYNAVKEDLTMDIDSNEFEDYEYQSSNDKNEVSRLLDLVKGTTITLGDKK